MIFTKEEKEIYLRMKDATGYCDVPHSEIQEGVATGEIEWVQAGGYEQGPKKVNLVSLYEYCVRHDYDFYYPTKYYKSLLEKM